jgi:AcrR family transcriptional regulator
MIDFCRSAAQGRIRQMDDERRKLLFSEMLVELARKGYEEASLEEVLLRAGVASEEFEAHFGDLDECLFAAYNYATETLLGLAQASSRPDLPWPERVRLGLEAVLAEAAAKPEIARAMTRAFPAIRPDAYQRYIDLLGGFVPCFAEGRRHCEAELPAEVELMAVGAAEAIIFDEVDAGRAEDLPSMLPEILFSILVPFIGPDQAGAEMRAASPSR